MFLCTVYNNFIGNKKFYDDSRNISKKKKIIKITPKTCLRGKFKNYHPSNFLLDFYPRWLKIFKAMKNLNSLQ